MSDLHGGTRRAEHPVRKVLLSALLFLVCVGIGVGAAVVYTRMQPSLYSSKSVVRVFDPASLPSPNPTKVDPTRLVSLEVTYAQSQDVSSVADQAIGAAGARFDHVDWAALKDQDAIAVTCFAARPGDAVRCAGEYATAYIANRTASVPQSLNAAADLVQAKIDTTQAQADALGRLVAGTDPRTQPAKSKEYAAKQAALQSRITQLTQVVNQDRAQAQALAASFKVVQPAPFPTSKASPTPSRNYTIGLLGGAVLGLALLLVWQQIATLRGARHAPVLALPAAAPEPAAEPDDTDDTDDTDDRANDEAPADTAADIAAERTVRATPVKRTQPPARGRRRAGRARR